jgi:hypothetical protein
MNSFYSKSVPTSHPTKAKPQSRKATLTRKHPSKKNRIRFRSSARSQPSLQTKTIIV